MPTAEPRKPAVAFILVTLLISVLGIGLIIPVLPHLVIQFEGGDISSGSPDVGWLVAVYAVMQFLFSPILGRLSDMYGRRPILLVSLAGAGLDYVLMALAPSLTWLFVGRVISGITGANLSTAGAYIADVTPPEKRVEGFGLIGACFGIGFILGPALGGVLGQMNPRAPFAAAAALALCNALYGFFVLPESHALENRRPFSWRGANPLASLGALGRYPLVLGLAGTLLCAALAQMSLQATWVLYTSYRYSWTNLQTGLSLSLAGIMSAVVQGGLTRIVVPKLGERRSLVTGLLIGVVAFGLYGSASKGWLLCVFLVFGSLAGITMPAAQGMITSTVSPTEQGGVQGALASLQSVAAIIAPIVATHLFGYFTSRSAPALIPGIAFYMGAALMFVGVLLAIRSFRHVPAQPGALSPPASSSSPRASPSNKE